VKAIVLSTCLLAAAVPAVHAQAPVMPEAPIVVSGTLADEAAKAALLARLREVYGANRVVDQLAVGTVAVPANWNDYLRKLITPNLKMVTRGQLKVDGNVVSLRGDVANDAQRQQIANDIATTLNPT
jgi:OOP family OmpA-OmpF porin